MTPRPFFLNAGNEGPFTLDGTRTHLVGEEEVAIIDPGPDVDHHVRALVASVEGARRTWVMVTHGHADHAGSATRLAGILGTSVWGPAGVEAVDRPMRDGDAVVTDRGALAALHTPGHTRDHLAFHWKEERALFAGDLVLGRGDTTWVAEYPGCVADYLASLEKLRGLDLRVIFPAHGPPLDEPEAALRRFEKHRRERIRQVETVLARDPGVDEAGLLHAVYGESLPAAMRKAALRSLWALREYVETSDRRPEGGVLP
ncbi:MAG: MBL fold metallo-hydrolase [Gemmatimonadota bacterium]|nr:MBL fold metallo-hydrolase [Gemmatimonadota bacterium]